MLVPHRREDAELGQRRLAADQVEDALVLVGLEAVLGDQFGGDFADMRFGITSYAARSQRLDQPGEQAAAVGAADRGFDVVFRVRHHAEHVAPLVDECRRWR